MRFRSTLAAVFALFAFAVPAAAHRFEVTLAPIRPAAAIVSSEIAWTCAGTVCTADAPMSDAPQRLCSRFAREVGRVASFTVDGTALAPDALKRCNTRAK